MLYTWFFKYRRYYSNYNLFSNAEILTDDGFGFEDRLKNFLTKTNNHTTSFYRFLNSITDGSPTELIKKACKMKQVEIESLITFTSSRRVGKTRISLKGKELAIWRFDDFSVVDGCFKIMWPAIRRETSKKSDLGKFLKADINVLYALEFPD